MNCCVTCITALSFIPRHTLCLYIRKKDVCLLFITIIIKVDLWLTMIWKTKVFDIYIQPFLVNEFFHTDLQLKLNQTVTLHPSIIHCYSQSRRMGAAPLPRSTRLHAYAASRLCSSKILFWCVWGGGERENDLFQGFIYSVIFLFFLKRKMKIPGGGEGAKTLILKIPYKTMT